MRWEDGKGDSNHDDEKHEKKEKQRHDTILAETETEMLIGNDSLPKGDTAVVGRNVRVEENVEPCGAKKRHRTR